MQKTLATIGGIVVAAASVYGAHKTIDQVVSHNKAKQAKLEEAIDRKAFLEGHHAGWKAALNDPSAVRDAFNEIFVDVK